MLLAGLQDAPQLFYVGLLAAADCSQDLRADCKGELKGFLCMLFDLKLYIWHEPFQIQH